MQRKWTGLALILGVPVLLAVGPADKGSKAFTRSNRSSVGINRVVPPPVPIKRAGSIVVGEWKGVEQAEFVPVLRAAIEDPERGQKNKRLRKDPHGLRVEVLPIATDATGIKLSGELKSTVEELQETCRPFAGNAFDGDTSKKGTSGKVSEEAPLYIRKLSLEVKWVVAKPGGETIATDTTRIERRSTSCAKADGLDSAEDLKVSASKAAAEAILNQFIPRWEVHWVPISSALTHKEIVGMARAGDLHGAICKVRVTLNAEPKNYEALVLTGALYEVNGWLDVSERYYRRAHNVRKDKGSTEGLERIEKRRDQLSVLRSHYRLQYKNPKPPQFDCVDL